MTRLFVCLCGLVGVSALRSPRSPAMFQLRSTRRMAVAAGLAATSAAVTSAASAEEKPKFQRLSPIQFIAALGDPTASSGAGAQEWGLWREDPGPQGARIPHSRVPKSKVTWCAYSPGVYLRDFDKRQLASGKAAPAGWKFDANAWWVEEHGKCAISESSFAAVVSLVSLSSFSSSPRLSRSLALSIFLCAPLATQG